MLAQQELLSNYQDILLGLDYHQRLEKIARKYTKNTGLSWEDAVQTAYLKVFQAFQTRKFRQGGVENFYSWAVTVARYAIIDFVRKESIRKCQSLNANVSGTEITLLDTIPDGFSMLEATECADLIVKALEAIDKLDKCYPHRKYLELWQGKADGKTQTQLAAELRISQGEISKRWQELLKRIAESLGLFKIKDVVEFRDKLRLSS
jgi:RNA polymerase sporulation-specific sigma factor